MPPTSDPAGVPIGHFPRTPEERIAALELAVFGDKLQQIPGLIASVRTMSSELTEIKDMVTKLRDNRVAVASLVATIATFLTAGAALIAALRPAP